MQMNTRRLMLACSALLTGTAAHTQDTSEITLGEVIITAQHISEDLQKSALAVTALNAEALSRANVSQASDLSKLVPGLNIAQGGPSSQVYLRGVGNFGTNSFADPAVAFNMDGVYISRFTGVSGNFYDVERIEVLKGPQGTLYGRNATGGAINIITKKPTKDLSGGIGLELGNYDLQRVNGFTNVPVGDELAVRFAFQSTDRNGYLNDGYDDDVARSARLGVKFTPNDDTSLLFTGLYTKLSGRGPAQVPITRNGFYNNSDPRIGPSVAAAPILRAIGPPPNPDWQNRGVSRADGKLNITVRSAGLELNTKLSGLDLTLLGNHMQTDNKSKNYGPGFLLWGDDTAKQNSLEARLAADTGPLRWVTGLYYFTEKQQSRNWVDQGYRFNQTGISLDKLNDETQAAFAQATYTMAERWRLTGGLRFTRESKNVLGRYYSREALGGPPIDVPAIVPPVTELGCPPGLTRVLINTVAADIHVAATNTDGTSYVWPYCQDSITGKVTFNDTSWKVGLDFDISSSSMMYASVSKGFKAGGFFAAGDRSDLTGNKVKPETLTAFALGSKNRFLNNRLQLNGEVFFWNYKDHQESYLAPLYTSVPGFGLVTQNADAHIYGLDLEVDALLTDNDNLSAKIQYLHAEYTRADFVNASPGPGNPAPITACKTRHDTINLAVWHVNCDGQQMPRSPNLSLNADYSHSFRLDNGAAVVAGLSAQYSADYWAAVDYNPLEKQKSYMTWGADLTYRAASKKWSATLWGQNLSDKVVYGNAFLYPGSNGLNPGGVDTSVSFTQLRAPRTYGAKFNVSF